MQIFLYLYSYVMPFSFTQGLCYKSVIICMLNINNAMFVCLVYVNIPKYYKV